MNWPTLAFPIILIALIALYFMRYKKALRTLPQPKIKRGRAFEFVSHPMEKSDFAPLVIIVGVYAIVAFMGLGDMDAPQSGYMFSYPQSSEVVIDLGKPTEIGDIAYFTGMHTGTYEISISADGQSWVKDPDLILNQEYADLYKWHYTRIEDEDTLEIYGGDFEARYIKIESTKSPLQLLEVAFLDSDRNVIDSSGFTVSPEDAEVLFDEQDIVPDKMTYMNSTYFDEIYHARTAKEHIDNVNPYEISHPPLGKIIIAIGIKIFGMTPFGWRFMGTLFGVLMLIPLYILIKNMFGKTIIAACGTIMFAFDFMHFVQTRISTIDTYGVFFIILSYLFMWRYVSSGLDAPLKKTLMPLFLSGLCFGLGCASKWTVIYAGAGLALIYAVYLVQRGLKAAQDRKQSRELLPDEDMEAEPEDQGLSRKTFIPEPGGSYASFLVPTLAVSVLFFVIIPLIIYFLSYLPYWTARGYTVAEAFTSGKYIDLVVDNQKYMFTYHSGVDQDHPYASRWYQWIVDGRPILYFLKYSGGTKSAFAAFNNPLVAWAGLIAILSLFYTAIRRKSAVSLFILIGFFSQLAPWFFISRTQFAYHYFPSTVFLVLALCYVMNKLHDAYGKAMVIAPTAVTAGLFALFYPVLTGVEVSSKFSYLFLKWLPSWPFG